MTHLAYIVALQEAGLLERDERRGGYRLGLRVVELAGIVHNQIEVRKQALDEMDHLRDDVDLHASLGVLFEGDVMYLAQSPRKHLPALYTVVGSRAPAHCAAIGKSCSPSLMTPPRLRSSSDTVGGRGPATRFATPARLRATLRRSASWGTRSRSKSCGMG